MSESSMILSCLNEISHLTTLIFILYDANLRYINLLFRWRDAMLRKIINFYIVTTEDQVRLHVIEMQQLDKSTPVTALTRANTLSSGNHIEAVVEAIYRNNLTSIQGLEPILEGRDAQLLNYFNQLPGSREENRDQLRNQLYQIRFKRLLWLDWYINVYKLMNHIDTNAQVIPNHLFGSISSGVYLARENAYPWNEYAYIDISGCLTNDPKSLLILIGSLDGLLGRLKQLASASDYQFQFNFCDGAPQLDNHGMMITESGKMTGTQKQSQSRSLARFICERMIDVVNKNTKTLGHYEQTAKLLSTVVAKAKTPYLSNFIYNVLNPLPTIAEFIPAVLSKENVNLPLKLLNPSVPHVAAANYLIDWVMTQSKLPNHEETIIAQIKSIMSVRQLYWQRKLNSLTGLAAPDGGHYNSTYTELMLLREATMHINSAGLMVLDVKQTEAYEKYYKEGEFNHNELEKELRIVCRHLGFEFLEKIDFHQEIVFTPKSSQILMDMGMHYSESYIKAMARVSYHNFFIFNRNAENNPFYALPGNVKARMIKFVEPEVDEAEIASIGLRN